MTCITTAAESSLRRGANPVFEQILRLQRDYQLAFHIEDICHFIWTGEAPSDEVDNRKRIPRALPIMMKAILKMFEVDENMTWKNFVTKFDSNGMRKTCHAEFRKLKARSRRFLTEYGIKASLGAIAKSGVVVRDHAFDATTKVTDILLALRPARIMEILEILKASKSTGKFKDIEVKKTKSQNVKSCDSDTSYRDSYLPTEAEFEQARNAASEADSGTSDGDSLTAVNRQIVVHTVGSNPMPSHPSSNELSGENKKDSPVASLPGEVSCSFIKTRISHRASAVLDELKQVFPVDQITDTQLKHLESRVDHVMQKHQITAEYARFYTDFISQGEYSNHWVSKVDFNMFLNAWSKIKIVINADRFYRQIDSSSDFFLSANTLESDLADDLKKIAVYYQLELTRCPDWEPWSVLTHVMRMWPKWMLPVAANHLGFEMEAVVPLVRDDLRKWSSERPTFFLRLAAFLPVDKWAGLLPWEINSIVRAAQRKAQYAYNGVVLGKLYPTSCLNS